MQKSTLAGAANLSPQTRVAAYDEQVFHYFLAVECKRSERSSRPIALVLIDLERGPGLTQVLDAVLAHNLFSRLSQCLRETDFLGWYQESRVVGGVLTQLAAGSGIQTVDPILRRVTESLFEGRDLTVGGRLHVRLYQLPAQAHELNEHWS